MASTLQRQWTEAGLSFIELNLRQTGLHHYLVFVDLGGSDPRISNNKFECFANNVLTLHNFKMN